MLITARFWNYCIGLEYVFFGLDPSGIIFSTSFPYCQQLSRLLAGQCSRAGQEGVRARRGGPVLASSGPKRSGRLHIGDLESAVRVFGFGEPLFLSEEFHNIPCFIVTGLALALLAKEQAVVLPVLIVLLGMICPPSVTRPIFPGP